MKCNLEIQNTIIREVSPEEADPAFYGTLAQLIRTYGAEHPEIMQQMTENQKEETE